MVVADGHTPAAVRGRPGDRAAAAERVGDARGGAVGGQGLRARAEVELDAGRDSNAPAARIEAHAPPSGARGQLGRRCRVGTEFVEVTVVSEVADRSSKGWVDGAVSRASDAQGDLYRLDQEIAHLDRVAVRLVDPRELGVGAEPAAGSVDPVEVGLEQLPGADDRARLSDKNRCRGPERAPA